MYSHLTAYSKLQGFKTLEFKLKIKYPHTDSFSKRKKPMRVQTSAELLRVAYKHVLWFCLFYPLLHNGFYKGARRFPPWSPDMM